MNILVIGPSWVGDMMMSHALYQQLKVQYPDCQIDVMAPDWCRPLLTRMPEVHKAISMPIGHGAFRLGERFQLGKALRNQYDMAIVLPNSFKSALIPYFAKIPVRRGWKGEFRYGLLNDLRTNKEQYEKMVERYVALAYDKDHKFPTGGNVTGIMTPMPYLKLDEQEIAETKAKFAELLKNEGGRAVFGFCPGAEFGPAKRWPHYHYAKLAETLIQEGKAVRIFGSKKDEEVGERIIQSLPEELRPYCVNLAGKTDLNEVVDLIAGCDMVISNDSGLMHIAAALFRPLIALYGPTSPKYTPPLSPFASVIRLIKGDLIKVRKGDGADGYHQSLIDITPEMVLERIKGFRDSFRRIG